VLTKLHGRTIAIDTHDLHVFEVDLDVARLGEALVAFFFPGLAVEPLGGSNSRP
jgi:hypothetical protein